MIKTKGKVINLDTNKEYILEGVTLVSNTFFKGNGLILVEKDDITSMQKVEEIKIGIPKVISTVVDILKNYEYEE